MEKPEYVMSDITPEPLKVHLDENGTTIDLPPQGATLNLDSSTLDPVEAPVQQPQKQIQLTRDKFMNILRNMLASEQITRQQMLEMRRRFGISNASFHKKKRDPEKEKRAKKLARARRRVNRLNNSTKGQKRNNGQA
jgi:hypothetical protein